MKQLGIMVLLLLICVAPAMAIIDPLAVPNNRVGIHILDTSEVTQAATLVNSNGGDWGYVTIVLRSNDLDRVKWTKFFEASRKLNLIPIIRLATYPDGGTWVRPDALDLVDFANFLADMPWPVKNKYVVLFNEVNHAAEWGGQVSPLQYATLLIDAKSIFKQRSDDFFLISAGLDMSSTTNTSSTDALAFYRQISSLQPKWYDSVDGVAVHAYPNPGFSSSAASTTRFGISSYKYEIKQLQALGYPPKPLFITETGWPHDQPFFAAAFNNIWQDPQIVAITPFLLFAGSGDFARFSLLNSDLSPRPTYRQIYDLAKISGSPLLGETILTNTTAYSSGATSYLSPVMGLWQKIASLWASILGQQRLTVGQTVFTVDVAQTEAQREQGLSGRSSLAPNQGMLFVFDQPAQHQFWMKDMLFPLDFVWIRGGKVVETSVNVPPPDQTGGQPNVLTPGEKVDQVLEISGGSVDKYGVKSGDIVSQPAGERGGDYFGRF
mgnify:CR=1 FL=1